MSHQIVIEKKKKLNNRENNFHNSAIFTTLVLNFGGLYV